MTTPQPDHIPLNPKLEGAIRGVPEAQAGARDFFRDPAGYVTERLAGPLADVLGNVLIAATGLILIVLGVARLFGVTPGGLLGAAARRRP